MSKPVPAQSNSRYPVVTGDFNTSPFLGRPDRPVEIGDRVIAHDPDPTVGDYWATVISTTAISDPERAAKYPFGLARLKVTWEIA